jgi:hypothetical protein
MRTTNKTNSESVPSRVAPTVENNSSYGCCDDLQSTLASEVLFSSDIIRPRVHRIGISAPLDKILYSATSFPSL